MGYRANVASANLENAAAIGSHLIVQASNQVMLGNVKVTSVEVAGTFVIYSEGRFKKK